MPNNIRMTKMIGCTVIDGSQEYHSTAGMGLFHTHCRVRIILIVGYELFSLYGTSYSHCRVRVIFIVEDPTVTVKC